MPGNSRHSRLGLPAVRSPGRGQVSAEEGQESLNKEIIYRGDELATVWQQWPKANDLDMLFCATDGQNEKPRGGGW